MYLLQLFTVFISVKLLATLNILIIMFKSYYINPATLEAIIFTIVDIVIIISINILKSGLVQPPD